MLFQPGDNWQTTKSARTSVIPRLMETFRWEMCSCINPLMFSCHSCSSLFFSPPLFPFCHQTCSSDMFLKVASQAYPSNNSIDACVCTTTGQLWKYGMVKGRFRILWKGWQPQIWDNFWWTSAVGLNSVNTFAVVSQRNIQMDLLMIGNQPVEYDKTTINLQMWNLINREQQMCFCLKSPWTRSTRCQL